MLESREVRKTWIMFNCALDVIILKWGREASGSGSDLLPWRLRYPLPPSMHCPETYNVPSPRKRVSVLMQCVFPLNSCVDETVIKSFCLCIDFFRNCADDARPVGMMYARVLRGWTVKCFSSSSPSLK